MIKQCPFCKLELALSEPQIAKIKDALLKLPTGRFLKISCPHCKDTMELMADGSLVQEKQQPIAFAGRPRQKKTAVPKPKPPNLEWLSSGKFEKKEVIKDVPMALLLVEENPVREAVIQAFIKMDYEPVIADSAQDAIERMRYIHFTSIVLHSQYEGNILSDSLFHAHMKKMTMDRRRSIFYVLIGPEFNTLYSLEALSYSANLVVNDKEVNSLHLIFKKTIPEYEALFTPYVNALVDQGNKWGQLWNDVRQKARSKIKHDVLKDILTIE